MSKKEFLPPRQSTNTSNFTFDLVGLATYEDLLKIVKKSSPE